MAQIVSIQVGLPQERDPEHPWTSGIFKFPVEGVVRVGKLNIEGDGQADLKNHGGVDKAILAYSAGHYPYWRADLPHLDWVHGAFGENLTVDGQSEDDVCIGDVYQVGTVRVEVSQPRAPCWKLARRWDQTDLTARVKITGHTGWYLRVLGEGEIEAGMALALEKRPYPAWTVTRATRAMDNWKDNPAEAAALAAVTPLAASWRDYLAKKLETS